jgi:AraC-like DNA-binding protein
MTGLTYIQGGDGWRREWRRTLGDAEAPSAVTVLNGHSRGGFRRDPKGAFSIKWAPRGRLLYRVQGATHALAGEQMVMLNQDQPYELEMLERSGTETLCVFVSDDLVAQAHQDLDRPDLAGEPEPPEGRLIPEFPDLVFRPSPWVRAELERLRGSFGGDDPSGLVVEERLMALVAALVGAAREHRRLASRIPAVKASTRRRLAGQLQRARELIEDADAEPSLDQLARASGISKFHLVRLFKAAFGAAPSAFAARRRMDRARGLLAATSMSVAQIGAALGYESAGAFIRAFRRHFGTTPQAIRI